MVGYIFYGVFCFLIIIVVFKFLVFELWGLEVGGGEEKYIMIIVYNFFIFFNFGLVIWYLCFLILV